MHRVKKLSLKSIFFGIVMLMQLVLLGLIVPLDARAQSVIASVPRATHTMTTELIDDVPAHVLIINNTGTNPDYKYQFLTGGIRLYIDRKDAFGWVPLISQVQTAPEYMRQQGSPGSFSWNPYGLAIATTGSNVHQGFDKQDQSDGSVVMVRTYSTSEEGVAETLTETWTVPADTLDLAEKGPKVTYSMTKNRGIVLDSGVQEGTWRMRWNISGIADITVSTSDIKDSSNWPIRKKKYSDGEFTVDVTDFDHEQNSITAYAFNEVSTNNKAEVLFFRDGTTGDRVIDPSIAVSNISAPWQHNSQTLIHHNGENFIVFYTKGSTSLFARAAPTIAGLASASEQTIVNAGMEANIMWDTYLADDDSIDVAYSPGAANISVLTVSVSGTTLTPSAAITHSVPEGIRQALVVRVPSSDRIWFASTTDTDKGQVFYVNEVGDVTGSSTITVMYGIGNTRVMHELSPHLTEDVVDLVFLDNPGGTGSDGIYGFYCSFIEDNCPDLNGIRNTSSANAILTDQFGSIVQVSDTELRIAWANDSAAPSHPYTAIVESSYNSTTDTWTNTTVESADDDSPSLFVDSETGDRYIFYADSANDDIYRIDNANAGAWGSDTRVDDSEADANTLPTSSLIDVPYQSTRTDSREMAWCYLNANSSNFDIVCDSLTLEAAPGGGDGNQLEVGGGINFRGGARIGN